MPKPASAALLAALVLSPLQAMAEADWQVTPRIEHSDVVINGRDATASKVRMPLASNALLHSTGTSAGSLSACAMSWG